MARAIGIPTRISAGLVYNNRTGTKPAFYYHAWAEVLMDADDGWVAVDPTFRQFPADSARIKLVADSLDSQVKILSNMGRLSFELMDVK